MTDRNPGPTGAKSVGFFMRSNANEIVVTPVERGLTLAAVLKSRLKLSWSQARRMIEGQRILVAGAPCRDAARRLNVGQRILIAPAVATKKSARTAPRKHAVARRPDINVRYQDEHIVVVEKPAGLTTMRHADEREEFGARGKRFLPKTLADWLPQVLAAPGQIFAVHRLDRDTTGLIVFARTKVAERELGKQFRAHSISRTYVALVRGRPVTGRIESRFVDDRGDGRRGSSADGHSGQTAITHVRSVEELGELTLVECRLETGRTHQVRIHLGEASAPICGETIYDRPVHGAPAPDPSAAPRILLHAAHLGLQHPTTGKRLEWGSPLPEDMMAIIQKFRSQAKPSPASR